MTRRIRPVGDCGDCYEYQTPSWSGTSQTYTLFLFKCDGVGIFLRPDGTTRRVAGQLGEIACSCMDFCCRLKKADLLDASTGCKHARKLQEILTA